MLLQFFLSVLQLMCSEMLLILGGGGVKAAIRLDELKQS